MKESNTIRTELMLYACVIALFSITMMILFARVRKNESMQSAAERTTVVAENSWLDMLVDELE